MGRRSYLPKRSLSLKPPLSCGHGLRISADGRLGTDRLSVPGDGLFEQGGGNVGWLRRTNRTWCLLVCVREWNAAVRTRKKRMTKKSSTIGNKSIPLLIRLSIIAVVTYGETKLARRARCQMGGLWWCHTRRGHDARFTTFLSAHERNSLTKAFDCIRNLVRVFAICAARIAITIFLDYIVLSGGPRWKVKSPCCQTNCTSSLTEWLLSNGIALSS